MKACTGCRKELPLTEFHRHRQRPDGHQSRCKLCQLEAVNTARAKDPERHRAYARNYMRETNNGRYPLSVAP